MDKNMDKNYIWLLTVEKTDINDIEDYGNEFPFKAFSSEEKAFNYLKSTDDLSLFHEINGECEEKFHIENSSFNEFSSIDDYRYFEVNYDNLFITYSYVVSAEKLEVE